MKLMATKVPFFIGPLKSFRIALTSCGAGMSDSTLGLVRVTGTNWIMINKTMIIPNPATAASFFS
jgi:hypothetical protein